MKILNYPKTGDLLFTRSDSFLGSGIRYFQKMQGEGDAPGNHIAQARNEKGGILDILSKVEIGHIKTYIESGELVCIIRIRDEIVPYSQKKFAIRYCEQKWLGAWYGLGKIPLQILDSVFRTNWWTAHSLTDMPYCSEAPARAHVRVNGFNVLNSKPSKYNNRRLFFENPRSITPANWYYDAVNRPDVYQLFAYVRTPKDEWEMVEITGE